MKVLSLTFLAFVSMSSFASSLTKHERDYYAEATFINEGKTRFNTLTDLHASLKTPPTLADFKNKICLTVSSEDPDELIETSIAVQGKVLRAAEPARMIPAAGPMFPAQSIPAKPEVIDDEKAVIGSNAGNFGEKFLNVFQNQVLVQEFMIFVPKNNLNLFSDVGADLAFSFKKDPSTGYLIYVVHSGYSTNNRDHKLSGYCYKN